MKKILSSFPVSHCDCSIPSFPTPFFHSSSAVPFFHSDFPAPIVPLQFFHSCFPALIFSLSFSQSLWLGFQCKFIRTFTWQNLESFCNIFLILEHWDRRKSMKKKKIMIPCITKRLATIEDEKKNINSTFGNKNYQSMSNNV